MLHTKWNFAFDCFVFDIHFGLHWTLPFCDCFSAPRGDYIVQESNMRIIIISKSPKLSSNNILHVCLSVMFSFCLRKIFRGHNFWTGVYIVYSSCGRDLLWVSNSWNMKLQGWKYWARDYQFWKRPWWLFRFFVNLKHVPIACPVK